MKTRVQEIEEMLSHLDGELETRYPEQLHDWLHYAVALKVKLECELRELKSK